MGEVSVTSASQILESSWNNQHKKKVIKYFLNGLSLGLSDEDRMVLAHICYMTET